MKAKQTPHKTRWLVFHASASYPLVTVPCRTQSTTRSSKDVLSGSISEDWLKFFLWLVLMNHWSWVCLESGTQFPWITPHILKKRFIFLSGFPIASGLRHSPREAKHEGSQTSYFNLSNEWGSLPFPIDILIDSLVLEMSEYSARFATRIQRLLFQFCEEGWPVNMARIWVTQRPLNSVKPVVKLQWHCIRRQLKRSRLHTFITDIHQKRTYTSQDDVQRCDLTHMPGLGLARTDAHDCFDRVQWTGLMTTLWKPIFKVF